MRTLIQSLAALFIGAVTLHAQTVDELVAKYAQRVGGAERLQAIQSVRRTGKFYGGGGFEAQVANENKRPNKVREEFAFGGEVRARLRSVWTMLVTRCTPSRVRWSSRPRLART